MRYLPFSVVVILTMSLMTISNAEGFYKWKDARGQIQYGDEPPANIHAKKVKLPAITVLEDYGNQWEYIEETPTKKTPPPVKKAISTPILAPKPKNYSTLTFIAPKPGQLIQAENGDVSAMLSIKPPLKKSHQLLFILDGKKAVKSNSRIANFPGLSNGAHTISVNIINNQGDTVQRGNTLNFKVMR